MFSWLYAACSHAGSQGAVAVYPEPWGSVLNANCVYPGGYTPLGQAGEPKAGLTPPVVDFQMYTTLTV